MLIGQVLQWVLGARMKESANNKMDEFFNALNFSAAIFICM